MRKVNKFMSMAIVAIAASVFAGCSSDSDNLSMYERSTIKTRAAEPTTTTIGFEDASSSVMASDQYGNNLYSATAKGNQVTTGYMAQIGQTDTYVQFPINYLMQEWTDGQPWEYEFWNGGFAVSNFHNMTQADYMNQCSVYSQSGGYNSSHFIIAYGYSDNFNDSNKAYDKCAKIYLTDRKGYHINKKTKRLFGKAQTGVINSLYLCNTTYSYLVMKNGNSFTNGSLQDHNGWFKVIFVALDKNNMPTGKKVEYYLANFDSNRIQESGLTNSIREGWQKVDLSSLGIISTVAINFEGSDSGQYGLNTPAYVAIDDIDITVK